MVEDYGKYPLDGLKNGDILCYNPMDGNVSTIITEIGRGTSIPVREIYKEGRGEEIGLETDKLNLSLINLVLSRSGFSDVEVLGYADGLSLPLYYFCRFILLFLLLSGLLNSALFVSRSTSLPCFLKARGVGAFWQILGEYLAYFGLVLAGFFALCLPLVYGLERELIGVPEWEGMGAAPFWRLLPAFVSAAAMFAALQFLLYEAAEGIVNGILLQLICGIGMGYLSGYFYPSAFFPEKMRALGGFLPSGAAARLVEEGIWGRPAVYAVCVVFVWLAVFFALTVVVRMGRIRKG